MKKVIIAGAGFAGATVARKLADAGYQVEIYERRDQIGGNAYDYMDESKSYVHQYGPHIFHTSIDRVFDFLSNYTEWFEYKHKVLGYIEGKYVPIPFSLNSLEMCFPESKAQEIKNKLISKYGLNNKVTISELRKENDDDLIELSNYVYENVFLNYTKKQWGLLPEQLGDGVTGRVPVSISYEDGYFRDTHQYMPKKGFTELFKNMLNHKNIRIHLGVDILNEIRIKENSIAMNEDDDFIFIYTGCIDELFSYKYGELEYRSLRFDFENVKTNIFQPAAVVNYPNDNDFTRISEFKSFTIEGCKNDVENTTIVREYPCKYEKGMIPYYPIPLKECEEKYHKYADYAKKFNNLYLIGRLAEYKYYNMDLVVNSAIEMAEKIIKGE
jgi:UDP-galactopyranose mutase